MEFEGANNTKCVFGSVYVPPGASHSQDIRLLKKTIGSYQRQYGANTVWLAGDFNCESQVVWRQSGVASAKRLEKLALQKKLSQKMDGLMQKRRLNPGDYGGVSPATHYHPDFGLTSALDYILAPTHIDPCLVRIEETDASDHCPMVATASQTVGKFLGLSKTYEPGGMPKATIPRRHWTDGPDELRQALNLAYDRFLQLGDKPEWIEWKGLLEKVLEPPGPATQAVKSGKHGKIPVSASLKCLRRQRRRAFSGVRAHHILRRTGGTPDPAKLSASMAKYKVVRSLCKQQFKKDRASEFERRRAQLDEKGPLLGDWWEKARNLGVLPGKTAAQQRLVVYDAKGKLCTGTTALNQWTLHFSNLAKPVCVDIESIDSHRPWSQQGLGLLREVTSGELTTSILGLKRGKSAGPDGITNETLQLLLGLSNNGAYRTFQRLLTQVMHSRKVPDEWKVGFVVPVHKKGDKRDTNNYRGIALLQCAFKLLQSIVTKRLNARLEATNFFIPEQQGFRIHGECISQTVTLVEFIQRRRAMGQDSFVCFIDFRKAYDLVQREPLFLKLRDAGFSKDEVDYFRNVFQNQQLSMRVKRHVEEPFPYDSGLLQGASESPLLFDVFINDILTKINDLNLGVLAMPHMVTPVYQQKRRTRLGGALIADDLAVIAPSF